jgi:hypothetical protein
MRCAVELLLLLLLTAGDTMTSPDLAWCSAWNACDTAGLLLCARLLSPLSRVQ